MKNKQSSDKKTGIINPEEGKQRLIEHNKEHPPKQLKNLKGEEMKAHNLRMGAFWQQCKIHRGFETKIMADPNELVSAIDEYISSVEEIGLFPTFNGLSLFCNISSDTLYAMENLGDERSSILKKYRAYISEFFNQSGLTSSTNPVFSIYYGKSVLGQSDQAPIDVNVNFNGPKPAYEPDKIEDMIQLAPEDYKEKT
jgi:hypothetical protein